MKESKSPVHACFTGLGDLNSAFNFVKVRPSNKDQGGVLLLVIDRLKRFLMMT